MTPSDDPGQRLITRVGLLLREAMQERGLRWCDLPVARETLARVLHGRKPMLLVTLARLADAMNYDIVIHLRDRAAVQDVRKEVSR